MEFKEICKEGIYINRIKFNNVSKFYGEIIGLNEVSFSFNKGIIGLVGTNGAGKSTTIKLCTSLIKEDIGTVTVNGEEIWLNYDYLSKMGYAAEKDRQFNWMSGREFLEWNGKMFNLDSQTLTKRIKSILDLVGLKDAADRKIQGYSRGMRQRIKIGQTLLNDPEIIFVDEPMSGTDPLGRIMIADTFTRLYKDLGATIVLSSHVLHELERLSTSLIIIDQGKLVAKGSSEQIREKLSGFPRKFRIHCDNSREVLKSLVDLVIDITIKSDGVLDITTKKFYDVENQLLQIQKSGVSTIFEFYPLDSDLNSVYSLLKAPIPEEEELMQ